MNMVIDIGNTLTKTAIFNDNELSSFSSFEKLTVGDVTNLLSANVSVKNVLLSSVIEQDKSISEFLKLKCSFFELSHETPIPIENLYYSPQTLGNDRLAAAVGVNFHFRNKNALSIDTGTCIKYDFVNDQNQYLGGGISPGIDMRFKALNKFTDKLPLLSYEHFDKLIGSDTKESILSGVMNGVTEEVKGIIFRYTQQYPRVKTVFTGGYLKFFEKLFNPHKIEGSNEKSNIFADPFLVLRGLNHILKYNEKK